MNIMKKLIILFVALAALLVLIVWIAHGNTDLEINKINVKSKNIPSGFDNFRIAQISDLHNAEFGEGNEKLLALLKQADADIIAITGDMLDSRRTDMEIALSFAKEAVKIAPVYYVNGNHEARIAAYAELKQGLMELGVTVLENTSVDITAGDEAITLTGINDPAFRMKLVDDTMEQNIAYQLSIAMPDNDQYKILLAHRPEYVDVYAGHVDLVLSGHAHGGQIKLPFAGGIFAPGQGFFPQYYEGLYTEGNTNMIVSRGLGNSIMPFRINNKPEIVVAELTKITD